MAPIQAVIVPIWRKAEEREQVLAAAQSCLASLEQAGIRAHLDAREGVTPGFKFNDWEMRGTPVRIEIGPRDVAAGSVILARRDIASKEAKVKAPIGDLATATSKLLDEIQDNLLAQARAAMTAETRSFDNYEALRRQMEGEGGGGLAEVHWCGDPTCETRIREETKATCRAIPLNQQGAHGPCIVCGKDGEKAFFAKAYLMAEPVTGEFVVLFCTEPRFVISTESSVSETTRDQRAAICLKWQSRNESLRVDPRSTPWVAPAGMTRWEHVSRRQRSGARSVVTAPHMMSCRGSIDGHDGDATR